MPLSVTSKRLPDAQRGGEDSVGRRTYEETFEVDQTDAGPLAAGVAVAIAAQTIAVGDLVPLRGDNYSYGGTTDLDSYAFDFSWQRPAPVDRPRRWHIGVKYGPAEGDPGQLGEDDPLLWPTEYWVEWTEEQVPIETARIVESLDHVGRAAGSLGPIINSAGEQQIDPQMKTVYYPILSCQKAYPTLNEIVALNTTYQDSTNNGVFFGAPARSAKYLLTESGRLQQTQGVSFYLGITRIWFRNALWDRRILNNGMMHLRKKTDGTYRTAPGGSPRLFRHMLEQTTFNTDGSETTDVDESGAKIYVPSPEPANLALDGTVLPKNQPGLNLNYRYLTELNYAGIGIGS